MCALEVLGKPTEVYIKPKMQKYGELHAKDWIPSSKG